MDWISKISNKWTTVDHKKKGANAELGEAVEFNRGNLDRSYPSDFSETECELISSVKHYTMTSQERLVSLLRAVEYVENNRITGDIVECGVWRGGGMMLVARFLKLRNSQWRKLFLFDTYEGMSAPSGEDISLTNERAIETFSMKNKLDSGTDRWCYASFEEVKMNMYSTGYDFDNICLIKGKVEETLPNSQIGQIAILRLDTDWYESTKHELDTLYDKLVSGGVLIIDDYGHWRGAKKAVDEFFVERNIPVFLNRVDYTCRILVKQ